MSILAKYLTYHMDEGEPEVSVAEKTAFDMLDLIRNHEPMMEGFASLDDNEQENLVEGLVAKVEKSLRRDVRGMCIVGMSDLHIGSLMHEAMERMPLIIVDDRPMEIVRMEVEDLMTDIDILKIAPPKPKKTFVMPHTKKRGNSWDGMR